MADIVIATVAGSLSMGAVFAVLSFLHDRTSNRAAAEMMRRHLERYYTEGKR